MNTKENSIRKKCNYIEFLKPCLVRKRRLVISDKNEKSTRISQDRTYLKWSQLPFNNFDGKVPISTFNEGLL